METKNKKEILKLRKLKKFFPLKQNTLFSKGQTYIRAVEDISFEIYKGETFGLVGESGCGKTTLGRTILQMYPPTSGSAVYFSPEAENLNLDYIIKEVKKMPKYQSKASNLYNKSVKIDLKVEEMKDKLNEMDKDDQTSVRAVKRQTMRIKKAEFNSLELKKEASRQLREASRTIGSLILEENIEEIKDLLLEAIRLDEHASVIFAGLEGKKLESSKEVQEIFDKLNSFRGKKTLPITERTLDPEYGEKLEGNREEGINLTRLNKEEMRLLKRRLQVIFQDPYSSLDPRMTVGQIIGEAVVEHKMFKKGSIELEEYVLEVMDTCGLDSYMLHRFPHQFSGGQRQRIGIARALALKPDFVVCDEAVSALDVSIQSQIINLLIDLKEKEDLTYLFISHDLSVIKHISDRIGVMYLGNIVELGPAEEIYKNPLHPYTKALLSAIPTTDAVRTKPILLEGDIPSNINPPSGCKFRTRCPLATKKCAKEVPEYREIEDGHFVACHYFEKTKDMK